MDVQQLEAMLAKGRDSSLLRFSLGKCYLDLADYPQAITHLAASVEQDPGYSAAWKLLGKAHLEAGDLDAAQRAWEDGVAAAEKKGDVQAGKEMTVFLKRLDRKRLS